MLIADSFIMLNMPKTGSTFARQIILNLFYSQPISSLNRCLRRLHLYPQPVLELLLHEVNATHLSRLKTQHGTYEQIPDEYLDRRIMTVTRHPLSRFVSAYRFAFWKKHPPAPVEQLNQHYPSFPDLTFAEWYDMSHRFNLANRLGSVEPRIDLGVFTAQFIQFYFPEPTRILRRIDDAWIESGSYRDEMPEITFLHQERLNQELKQFLIQEGFSSEQLRIIDEKQPVNVSDGEIDRSQTEIHDVIDESSLRQIQEREKLLFHLFPEYRPDGRIVLDDIA